VKPQVSRSLNNSTTCQLILLESCSNSSQKTQWVFMSELKSLGFVFFVGDVISGAGFWPFWLRLPGSEPQLLDGSILLRFSLETREESKSFKPLIDFLRFQVQNLWLFSGHIFSTRSIRKANKGSKQLDSNLVSNKNLSEILPFCSWGQAQVTWAKMAKNLSHLWRHPQKTQNQNFIQCKLEDLPHFLRVWTAH